MLAELALGGRYPAIVGDAAGVADELEDWIDAAGIDGFNLARTVVPESYEEFVDIVVPELQSRGSHKTAYAEGSLRQKLFGKGDRLPASHYGSHFRAPDLESADEPAANSSGCCGGRRRCAALSLPCYILNQGKL